MYITILTIPILSLLISTTSGRYLSGPGVVTLTNLMLGLTTINAWLIFYEVGIMGGDCVIEIPHGILGGQLELIWGMIYDKTTSIMLTVITTISLLVHLYSTSYMKKDPHLPRFMSYLTLFTWFMIILVTSDNLIQMFIGWEGVGVSSYLLINFWWHRIFANQAAIKAMIMNRIGDLAIIASICLTEYNYGTTNYSTYLNEMNILESTKTVLGIMLLIGAMGKSAQIGLHTWLPDAMEGPTPVSALIHAATMVTAGIYLVIRNSLTYTGTSLTLVTIVGGLTLIMAATIGLVQMDIKRVIAYSTCSQLGYMMMTCGMSNFSGALFHLNTHAYFKALLFLGAGSVIHAINNEQDLRRMGGLTNRMPITYITFLIGSLTLIGTPYLSGYYSKDFIIEVADTTYSIPGYLGYTLSLLGAICTAYYSIRLITLTFWTKTNKQSTKDTESDNTTTTILTILAIMSVITGYMMQDLFINSNWQGNIYQGLLNVEELTSVHKLIPTVCGILGGYQAFNIYKNHYIKETEITSTKLFLANKWEWDKLYNWIMKRTIIKGEWLYHNIDKGILETYGPTGMQRLIISLSQKTFYPGYVYISAIIMLLGIILMTTQLNEEILIISILILGSEDDRQSASLLLRRIEFESRRTRCQIFFNGSELYILRSC